VPKAKTKELTHSKRIAELIGGICERRPELPFSHTEIEIVHGDQLKPADFTIYNRSGGVQPVATAGRFRVVSIE